MAHNKLYRNFIILQEDERGYSSSNDKALSGYAKVEAKGDKCKISFYAQNLKKEDNYSMVLICCKRDLKQLVNLGSLTVDEVGKGDTSKEYYINNIAGLGISYEKISGAALCKIESGNVKVIMHGFMNGEETSENWRKFKIVNENIKANEKKLDLDAIKKEEIISKASKTNEVNNKVELEPKEIITEFEAEPVLKNEAKVITKEEPKVEVKSETKVKAEVIKAEVEKVDTVKENTNLNRLDVNLDDEEDRHKKKKDYCVEETLCKLADKLDDYECDINLDIRHLKEDVIIYGFVKNKKDDKCKWKKFKMEKKCIKVDKGYLQNSKRLDENTRLDGIDFEKYENSINTLNSNDEFTITGSTGKYFENIAKGFEPYKEKLEGINYCKWYKVKVNSMDDLCNKSNYDKYTLAYYPMINYYPYISKENYFLLGYKCNKEGELQYIVYGIPGSKDKTEQPYGGKTGFVTWTNDKKGSNGYWLMFYDYKKSSIVVPIK